MLSDSKIGTSDNGISRIFHSQLGFTLIEVTMVVAIIGIIAAIAIPQYQSYVVKTQVVRIFHEVSELRQAVEICLYEGRIDIGNGIRECDPGATGSTLIKGGSQTGINLSGKMGFAQFSDPLTSTSSIEAEISTNASNILVGKIVKWQRLFVGTWTCETNIDEMYVPDGCNYNSTL